MTSFPARIVHDPLCQLNWEALGPRLVQGGAVLTVLPTTDLYEGRTVSLLLDATTGLEGTFKYRVGGAYPWVAQGQAWIPRRVATNETTTSSTQVNLTTGGPSIALPFAGDWMIRYGAGTYISAGGSPFQNTIYAVGPTGITIGTIQSNFGGLNQVAHPSDEFLATGLTVGSVALQYSSFTGGNTAQFFNRWISAAPIRVG